MCSDGSITHWLHELCAGDRDAAEQLWQRYFRRLVHVARKQLGGAPLRASDASDVALSAFHTFCQGVEKGRFPRLDDRNNLSALLIQITARKASRHIEWEMAAKRGGGRSLSRTDLEDLVDAEPSPEFAAEVADQCRVLLERLGDDMLRSIAVWKMEGYTHNEIAEMLQCSPSTVARKTHLIRQTWEDEQPS